MFESEIFHEHVDVLVHHSSFPASALFCSVALLLSIDPRLMIFVFVGNSCDVVLEIGEPAP